MESERQEYNQVSPWWGEHINRYNEVIKSLRGNEMILDIASGNGYGTYLLSQNTKKMVIGGDIDSNTIHLSNKLFKKENLTYTQLDGTNLPFENNFFDVIVSFETIEHTKKYNEMINEFKRSLKPEGILYLSTPNSFISSPDGKIKNPFHTQEWNYDEINSLLSNHFSEVKIFGQMYKRYNDKKKMAYYVEKLLYMKGIRKIPIKIQDKIMNIFGFNSIYPNENDFCLVNNSNKIIKCSTFFAICKK